LEGPRGTGLLRTGRFSGKVGAHHSGLGWHGLRRKFATELKGASLKELSQLGGWKDPQTILKCYQSADEESMRAALAERRVLRGAAGR